MRKILVSLAAVVVVVASPAVAQSGPKYGKNGGIGASSCTYSSGEPTGGGSACTYSIDGTTGTATIKDVSPSGAAPTGGTVIRPLRSHLLDITNPLDFGAVASGGSGDTVTGPALVNATKSTPRYVIWSLPYNGAGYVANADPSCTDTVYCYTGAINPGTLRNENPGIYFLNNNTITGTMGGQPEIGRGTFATTYTNPYNVTTNLRMQFDPAAIPSRGPNVTYQGLSLECLPQRPNPNDSAANLAAKKRGALCMYLGMDTGTGGEPGSAYGSELLNLVQNVSTNSGTSVEINTNFNGQVLDGGFTRSLFITGGGNYTNHSSSAIEINHGCYSACADGGDGYYGNGVVVRGATNHVVMQRGASGESGYFLQGFSETNGLLFSVNKQAAIVGRSISIHNASDVQTGYIDTNGFIVGAGVESTGNVKSRSLTVVNGSNVTRATIDTNGFSLFQGVESAGNMLALAYRSTPRTFAALGGAGSCNAGNAGYIAAISDSTTNTWGATVTGGGALYAMATCNGVNWTVMGK